MTHSDSIARLIKWLARDDWRDAFAEVLDQHLGRACNDAGIDVDDISWVLEDGLYNMLWGCVFEDFLTRVSEGGANIVDAYLERRGWTESASSRAYMEALRSSVMSLYEASEIVPGQSVKARDLLRGGEPILVGERTATRTLKPWDRVGARIVKVGPTFSFSGAMLLFRHETSEELLVMLKRAFAKAERERRSPAKTAGPDGAIRSSLDPASVLGPAAPLFSTVWLRDALDRVLNRRLPKIQNTDGDEFLFCTVRWPVRRDVRPSDIENALDCLAELRKESATFWNWTRPSAADRPGGRRGRHTQARTDGVILDDGSTVLGSVKLRSKTVLLEANSLARAERGKALLSSTLASMVGTPLIDTMTPEQAVARGMRAPAGTNSSGLSAEEQTKVIHTVLEQHYRETLDEPVGMLGGKTPRQAARSRAGRAKLVGWLKYLENASAHHPPGDPMRTYDLGWLWQELGVADGRR